MNTSDVGFCRS